MKLVKMTKPILIIGSDKVSFFFAENYDLCIFLYRLVCYNVYKLKFVQKAGEKIDKSG